MKSAGNVVLLLAFVVVLLIAIGVAIMAHNPHNDPEMIVLSNFTFSWVVRVAGAFIAGLSALLMLGRAINDFPLIKLFALMPPFFAGLLLIEVHWSVALSLGAIGLAFAVRSVAQALRGHENADP